MSLSLRLDGVSFAFGDDQPLLDDITLHLTAAPGAAWTGVVGTNGGGKTTLLRLLLRELSPQRGCVEAEPADAVVHLCTQRADALPPEVAAFAEDWSGEAMRWRSRLAVGPEDVARWDTLSPGERKRWQIAAALTSRPDVLLLDEPSNHLDVRGRALLVEALRDVARDGRCLGVVVSHDRALLDALCHAIVRVDGRGGMHLWPGDFTRARDAWRLDEENQQARWEAARSESARLRRELARARHEQASAASSLSARTRMDNPGDNEARGVAAKGRARKAEARLSQRVAAARSRTERALEGAESAALGRLPKTRGTRVFLDWEPAPRSRLVELVLPKLVVGAAGERRLLDEVSVVVTRDSRVHIAGPNGAGKTTLLRALLHAAWVPLERLLYVPQHLPAEAGVTRLAALRELSREARGCVLTMVAALGVDPDRLLATERPSPGEARKLEIAWGLGRRAWLLVLDEPTNHLDLPSLERLEVALADWPGALVLVSHDDAFAAAVTDERWTLHGGRVEL